MVIGRTRCGPWMGLSQPIARTPRAPGVPWVQREARIFSRIDSPFSLTLEMNSGARSTRRVSTSGDLLLPCSNVYDLIRQEQQSPI